MMALDAVIIGAGAMGSCLAFHLARAGFSVGLAARGERLESLRANGVQAEIDGRVACAEVRLADTPDDLPPAGTIFLCVKTFSLPYVIERLRGTIAPATRIVTVQNGVEAPWQMTEAFPDAHVIASRVHGFFEMEGNVVVHRGVPPSFLIGGVAHCPSSDVTLVAEMLAKAGLAAPVSEDIAVALWQKFMLAAAIGGVGAALGVPAGAIMAHADGRSLLHAAMAEIAELARLRGISLAENAVANTLAFVETFPADATSSLQRDLEAGRLSEYDALPGAVLRLANEAELDTPVHRSIDAAIRKRGLL